MKTYDEMAKSALFHAKKIKEKRRKAQKTAICILSALVIVSACVFALQKKPAPETKNMADNENYSSDDIAVSPEQDDETVNEELPPSTDISAAPQTVGDLMLVQYLGKTVTVPLKEQFENAADDGKISVVARPFCDLKFVYKGKTLEEYFLESEEERLLPEKLQQLLKEGDSLKYGSALYEGTAPNGEKWYKSLYDERIAFYGEKILSAYIKDGEFLSDKLKSDISAAESSHKAADGWLEAYTGYVEFLAEKYGAGRSKNNLLIFSLTRSQFEKLDCQDGWTFYLNS